MEKSKLNIQQMISYIKDMIIKRKVWILAGILVFLFEMALLVYPVGWLGEEKTNFLSGEDSWTLKATSDNAGYCQEFIPEFENLKSLSILLTTDGQVLADGQMMLTVSDSMNQVVFSKEFSYGEIVLDRFMDVETNLCLDVGESYYLSVNMGQDANGSMPSLRVCGMDHFLPENKMLMQTEIVEDTQLVARYVYTDAIEKDRIFKVCILCMITAFLVMFGLPRNDTFRKIAGVAVLVLLPYILGRRLELLTIDTQYLLPFAMKWNLAFMYILEVVLLLLTHSCRFTTIFTTLLLTVVYSANYYVYTFRGVAIKLNELTAVGTAAKVVGGYDLTPNTHMAMAWCMAFLFVIFGFTLGKEKKKEKHGKYYLLRLASAAMGIILAGVTGYQLLYTDLLEKNGFMNLHGFDQHMSYHFNGFLVSTCFDIQNSRIEKPLGYSVSAVEEILKNVEETQGKDAVTESTEGQTMEEEQPHIILIMNESFSDLRVLGNLQLSEENLPFFNSLTDNTIRGYVNASVIGGGTANSEFEVFTGCSMGLLPASYYAYQQCMVKPVDSMVTNMEKNGYSTYSIHPETERNWNRNRVYEYLDFDNSLWIEEFKGAETLNYGVTDGETYRKVEELFENREKGEKMFIFDLTVQNHGGYSAWEGGESVIAENISSDEVETYLSLIKTSDKDFEELIHYFENQDEKVIICMFGDHQPKLEDSFYENVYQQTEGITEEDRVMNKYKTPFVIWANYDIPEQNGIDISMNYLGVLLMDTLGLEMSDYFYFLKEQMQEYPIITINGYQDADGVLHQWDGSNGELLDYRMLQYNYLFDKNTVTWGY